MLGVISGKIDLILLNQAEEKRQNEARFAKIEARQDATEEDVAALKRDRAWVLGAAATVSALGATVAGWLGFGK
ncbi:hypothetical protein [Phenylobacterium sp.]|uniref:hypothetical protein n=1 Tax=Phenylobacterium sp. TaxID=1871053 RepID=UPI00392CD52F